MTAVPVVIVVILAVRISNFQFYSSRSITMVAARCTWPVLIFPVPGRLALQVPVQKFHAMLCRSPFCCWNLSHSSVCLGGQSVVLSSLYSMVVAQRVLGVPVSALVDVASSTSLYFAYLWCGTQKQYLV
jgi:hypothetical protein